MAHAQPKLLFVTRSSPFAGSGGSGTYVFDVLRYLSARGFVIRVLWTEPPDLVPSHGWYEPPGEARGIFDLEIMQTIRIGRRFWRPSVTWLPFKARMFDRIKTVLRTLGLWQRRPAAPNAGPGRQPGPPATGSGWGHDCTAAEIASVQSAIARWQPDVVLANYAWMAPAVRSSTQTQPPCAVLSHDVRHRQLHLHEGRLREAIGDYTSPETERQQLQSADAIIAIQEPEAAIFRRMLPGKTVVTAPMSAHLQIFPPINQPTLLFVGSNHGPNVFGLRWFLAEIWPSLKKDQPAAKLLIAGTICSVLTETLPDGVRLLGRLSDLSSAYAQAAVVIAPIFQGSGIKIKLLEAIGYGRACVTTSVGLEGLEALREDLGIADTAPEFTRLTLSLLRDPAIAAAQGAALQAKARIQLSPETCYEPIARVLHALASGREFSP